MSLRFLDNTFLLTNKKIELESLNYINQVLRRKFNTKKTSDVMLQSWIVRYGTIVRYEKVILKKLMRFRNKFYPRQISG